MVNSHHNHTSSDMKDVVHSLQTLMLTTAIHLVYNAFALINFGLTGYLSSVRNLTQPADQWIAGGVPLTMMMNMEKRHGENETWLSKSTGRLDGPVFKQLQDNREDWAMNDRYLFPGAVQYFGPSSVCDITTVTLQLERSKELASV